MSDSFIDVLLRDRRIDVEVEAPSLERFQEIPTSISTLPEVVAGDDDADLAHVAVAIVPLLAQSLLNPGTACTPLRREHGIA